ncbi:hypothetical protein CXP39_01005 [Mesoplasma syrphidae]|uniref:Uncharacterized protein n=1 Tax=Mesoplasma syrphidae TaxID=225999 RepID=A0A2K9CCL3_9MOLU|nr:hypothetical protein [Mesoplasma syrphidae]AUF83384.1 hypothetical protein CXP39_01005 [Mesoplasma syrphidae]
MKKIFRRKSFCLVTITSIYIVIQISLLLSNKLTVENLHFVRLVNTINFFVVGTLFALTIANFVRFISQADLIINHKVSVNSITEKAVVINFVKSVASIMPIILTKSLYLIFEKFVNETEISRYTQILVIGLILVVLISTIVFAYFLLIYFQKGQYFEDEHKINLVQWFKFYRPKSKEKDKRKNEKIDTRAFIRKVVTLLNYQKTTIDLIFKIKLTHQHILTKKQVSPFSQIT